MTFSKSFMNYYVSNSKFAIKQISITLCKKGNIMVDDFDKDFKHANMPVAPVAAKLDHAPDAWPQAAE